MMLIYATMLSIAIFAAFHFRRDAAMIIYAEAPLLCYFAYFDMPARHILIVAVFEC